MIQAFKIINHLGKELYLELRKPEDTGFLVTSVTGLEYPDIELSAEDNSNYDGAKINRVRVSTRNIVMNITFYEDNKEKLSVEDLRWKLQSYFLPKMPLIFIAINEHGSFYVLGYVESSEINIFTNMESAQISILCEDPYFRIKDENLFTELSMVKPLFEFPFPTEGNDEVEFGEIKSYPSTEIDYKGQNISGVLLTVEILGTVSGLKINNTTRKETIAINDEKLTDIVLSTYHKGDVLQINTEKGKKYAYLIRDGVTYNILNACLPVRNWPQLQMGINSLTYSTNEKVNNVRIFIEYETKLLGI